MGSDHSESLFMRRIMIAKTIITIIFNRIIMIMIISYITVVHMDSTPRYTWWQMSQANSYGRYPEYEEEQARFIVEEEEEEKNDPFFYDEHNGFIIHSNTNTNTAPKKVNGGGKVVVLVVKPFA